MSEHFPIPKVRKVVLALTKDMRERGALTAEETALYADAIERMINGAVRHSPVRKTKGEPTDIPPYKAREIRRFAEANPDKTTQEIAVLFGVRNGGRISDVLTGRRP